MEHIKNYKCEYTCDNCRHRTYDLVIPMGVKVREFLQDKKCEHCGCSPLNPIFIEDLIVHKE